MSIWTLLAPSGNRARTAAAHRDGLEVCGRVAAPPLGSLLERVAAGDKDAFAELYDLAASPLLRVLMLKVGDAVLAESALGETFLNVWREAPRFHGRDSAELWLLHRVPAAARPDAPAKALSNGTQ